MQRRPGLRRRHPRAGRRCRRLTQAHGLPQFACQRADAGAGEMHAVGDQEVRAPRGHARPVDHAHVGELTGQAGDDLVVGSGPAAVGVDVHQHHGLPVGQLLQHLAVVALGDVAVGAEVQHDDVAQGLRRAEGLDALQALAALAADLGVHQRAGDGAHQVVARAEHDGIADDRDAPTRAHARVQRHRAFVHARVVGQGKQRMRPARRPERRLLGRRLRQLGRAEQCGRGVGRRHRQRPHPGHGERGRAQARAQCHGARVPAAQRVGPGAAQGRLHEPVGQLRRGCGEQQHGRRQQHRVRSGAAALHDHEHRPVPQVQRERARAGPLQGSRRQRARHRPARLRGADDGQRRQHRGQQQAALVDEGQALVRELHGQQEQPQRQRAQHARRTLEDRRGRRPPGVPQRRQRRADAQTHEVRVAAQVDAAGVAAVDLGGVEPGHPGRAGQRHHHGQHGQGAASAQAQGAPRQQRPHDVELLLHRQRPQVLQQRRAAEGLEVRLFGDDLPPVRHVDQRRRDVAHQPRHRVGRQHRRHHGHHGDHREGRRQQAARPAQVEGAEVDAAMARVFAQQQRGDDEAGDDEEHVHAQEAGRREPVLPQVVGDDGEHGDAPQAVQAGQPRRFGMRGCRPRRRHPRAGAGVGGIHTRQRRPCGGLGPVRGDTPLLVLTSWLAHGSCGHGPGTATRRPLGPDSPPFEPGGMMPEPGRAVRPKCTVLRAILIAASIRVRPPCAAPVRGSPPA